MGLEQDETKLTIAKSSFPHCAFLPLSPYLVKIIAAGDRFDVILCSTSPDEIQLASFLPMLMRLLTPNGTLIAKIGPDSSPDDLFSGFVYKDMGESIFTSRDQSPLHIYHVKNRLPYAILLMGESGSGKSTVARHLFPGLPVIHGDEVMRELADLEPHALESKYNYLCHICSGPDNGMSVGGIMIQIFNSAAGKEYACLIADLAAHKDFVYDGVIHENFRHVFTEQLKALGYQVLPLDTPTPLHSPNDLFMHEKDEARKYQLYLEGLTNPRKD